jgi:hypothetical protein
MDQSTPIEPSRFSLLGIIGGLMVAGHLGDVHEEVFYLHDLVGLPRPEGNFENGWTDQDWRNLRSFE